MAEQRIRKHAEDFIAHKRSLGCIYENAEWALNHFVDYVETLNDSIQFPTREATNTYLEIISGSQSNLYLTVSTLREFSKYLHARGYTEAFLIPSRAVARPVHEPPYFFTEKELNAFFKQIDCIKPHKSFKGREYVFPAMFRLLYCCGLRCKEARTLECSNVHVSDLYIDILQSKGPKNRRIFISKELADYLEEYDANICLLFPKRKYYFPHDEGCYSRGAVSRNFRIHWQQAFPEFKKTSRPRAYDLRHHFAWANLNRWAAEGIDVNIMLPYLMRYMGHQSVQETMYYFHFVPEFYATYKKLTAPLENILPEVPDET
ncbi:MAG: tyrosine-type recombinase/integrase [Oscillospiraceae bacterium]|nr:tyrosine-type recombinase/integrase [Oscillospiraceae bacterium]